MKKKILIVSVLVILVIAGAVFSLLSNNSKRKDDALNARATQENYEQMMARMHPNQPANNDMAGNNMADCPSSHHGSGTQISNDKSNMDIKQISFESAIGQEAPDFTLTNLDGSQFKLSDYKGKTVVLFFNEGSMCYPACWDQIASFASDPRFNSENVAVASIVVDAKPQWDKISSSQPKYKAAILLFDTNKAVSKAYDVLNTASSMHPGAYPGHSYYIIDKEGKIAFVLDDLNMAINNDLLAEKISANNV